MLSSIAWSLNPYTATAPIEIILKAAHLLAIFKRKKASGESKHLGNNPLLSGRSLLALPLSYYCFQLTNATFKDQCFIGSTNIGSGSTNLFKDLAFVFLQVYDAFKENVYLGLEGFLARKKVNIIAIFLVSILCIYP